MEMRMTPMAASRDTSISVKPGDRILALSNNRRIVYRVDGIDSRAGLVIGVMLDEGDEVITGFMMSFEGWKAAAERSVN